MDFPLCYLLSSLMYYRLQAKYRHKLSATLRAQRLKCVWLSTIHKPKLYQLIFVEFAVSWSTGMAKDPLDEVPVPLRRKISHPPKLDNMCHVCIHYQIVDFYCWLSVRNKFASASHSTYLFPYCNSLICANRCAAEVATTEIIILTHKLEPSKKISPCN